MSYDTQKSKSVNEGDLADYELLPPASGCEPLPPSAAPPFRAELLLFFVATGNLSVDDLRSAEARMMTRGEDEGPRSISEVEPITY